MAMLVITRWKINGNSKWNSLLTKECVEIHFLSLTGKDRNRQLEFTVLFGQACQRSRFGCRISLSNNGIRRKTWTCWWFQTFNKPCKMLIQLTYRIEYWHQCTNMFKHVQTLSNLTKPTSLYNVCNIGNDLGIHDMFLLVLMFIDEDLTDKRMSSFTAAWVFKRLPLLDGVDCQTLSYMLCFWG